MCVYVKPQAVRGSDGFVKRACRRQAKTRRPGVAVAQLLAGPGVVDCVVPVDAVVMGAYAARIAAYAPISLQFRDVSAVS